MTTATEYEQKDNDCKSALKQLFESQSAREWLDHYESLFQSVIIAPAGLPPIVNAHLDDEFYAFISSFGQIYQSLSECQSELM